MVYGASMSAQTMPTPETPLLTAQEVADRLRVTVRTLQRMDADRVLVPIRVGRAVRYRPEDVQEFLDRQAASARASEAASA